MNEFHFLRPEWFWGFLIFLLLPFFFFRKGNEGGLWQKLCDSMLLRFQLVAGSGRRLFPPFFLAAAAWTIALLSLAGPTWEKLPQPAVKKGTDTVYVLDISVLMSPTDIKPSRVERARFKMHDFLQKTKDGQNALILYDQDPFVAVPLTTDQHIIDNLLPTIRAGMMGRGTPDMAAALEKAGELLVQAKSAAGRVVVLSGYLADDALSDVLKAVEQLKAAGYSVSFLGIGTGHGAPLQLADGSFLTHHGKPVLSALSEKNMRRSAQAGGGTYQTVTLGEQDVRTILAALPEQEGKPLFSEQDEAKADTWKDFGAVLCIFILPFAAFGYRKGWLGILLLSAMLPTSAKAWSVSDLWTRADRKEAMAIAAGEKPQNPAVFRDSAWRGAAAYKAGDYPAAVSALADAKDAETLYNQGNSLAQAGQYQQAIEAYKKVLEQEPSHEDAAFNKKYLEDQLKNNQKNQDQNQQKQSENQDQKQEKNQQQNHQNQNQENQTQQDREQQQNQQSSDQDREDSQNQNQEQNRQQQNRQGQEQNAQNQQEQKEAQGQSGGEQQTGSVQNQQKSDQKPQSEQKAPPEQKTDEDQAKQEQMQWLSVIEDDPSGLLRERIRRHNMTKRRGR